MNTANIRDHMEVFASCGTRVGIVDSVDGKRIKLTKHDAQAGGKHHHLPVEWVDCVDQHVYLNKDSEHVMREWETEAEPNAAQTAV